MKKLHSSGFWRLHPLLYRFFVLSLVTIFVYLTFRYLLGLFFPFLISYLMMRVLFPLILFLKRKWHFPNWLAYGGTLTVFFCVTFGVITTLFWQLWQQLLLFMKDFPDYWQQFEQVYVRQMGSFCQWLDSVFHMTSGTSIQFMMQQIEQFRSGSSRLISNYAGNVLSTGVSGFAHLLTVMLLVIVSMAALCKDMQVIHRLYRKSPFFAAWHRVALTLKKSGIAYLKSQGIIMLVIWALCAIGLALIHNPYSILLGGGIAVFDTFPVLGSGMILVPWAVFHVLQKKYLAAGILFVLFLLCAVVRDVLEAHLMGNQMGLLPFVMTAALYIGVRLFGVWGILLGPFGVVLIRAIYAEFV